MFRSFRPSLRESDLAYGICSSHDIFTSKIGNSLEKFSLTFAKNWVFLNHWAKNVCIKERRFDFLLFPRGAQCISDVSFQMSRIMTEDFPRVGFIGLGLMGRPMASNIMRKGHRVTVFNRSKGAIDELVAKGANSASSPMEVAKESDIVIDMVTDAPDVQDVILGKGGVIEASHKGLIVLDMSTNSPDVATAVSSVLIKKGVEFLDAPVTGGDKGAREGTLTIMVGGKKEVFEKCLPIFQCMGKEIVYMGDTGSGQATKLCNQVAVSLHTLATCESLLLGKATGLKLDSLLKVLTSGAASSWNLANLGPKIFSRDFEPGFKAAHLHKDLKYVMRLTETHKLALPGSGIVYQLFNSVLAENYGEKGTQVLARILEKLSEREIK